MKLPPGISRKEFNNAIEEFEQAVGKEWVFTSDEDVDLYRDAYTPFWGEEEELVASAAVAPDNVEEVQKVVRIANQYKIPIYPISTGKNLGYGGSAPTLSGSVILDLKRMNRILEVNEKNAYALVEPGVSYFDLYRYIQDKGYKIWIDTPDPGWGSLVGNALDRGGGGTATKYRNHFDAHCGMEVVLANGEIMRTGMGAMPGAKTWQQSKTGFGPWIDGMFQQSNFGVVTKMGFWLMPEPEAYFSGTVSVSKYKDLIPLVDIMSDLENNGVFNGMPFLGSPLMASSLTPGDELREPPAPEVLELFATPGGPSHEDLEHFCRKKDIGVWACKFQFYGPPKVIKAQWECTRERYSAIEGVRFEDNDFFEFPLTAKQVSKVNKASFGIPNLDIFHVGARTEHLPKPTEGHIWFSPIIPREGKEIFKAHSVFSEAARELGLTISPMANVYSVWERSFQFILPFPITHDVEINRKNREAVKALVKIAAEHGWGEYRTAPAYQDAVMETYSFNNHALLRFHETVKDAIDPNGILSPGRYGIWPKHLRDEKKS